MLYLLLGFTIPMFIAAVIYVLAGYAADCDPFYMFSGPKVVLVMFDGSINCSRRPKSGLGYLFPATKIGPMLMKEDGTIEGSRIVTRWYYYE